MSKAAQAGNVCNGSWLSENARTPGDERTSYSLKAVFAVKRASALNLENELRNVILAEFRSFAFSHSQGLKRSQLVKCGDFRFVLDL